MPFLLHQLYPRLSALFRDRGIMERAIETTANIRAAERAYLFSSDFPSDIQLFSACVTGFQLMCPFSI